MASSLLRHYPRKKSLFIHSLRRVGVGGSFWFCVPVLASAGVNEQTFTCLNVIEASIDSDFFRTQNQSPYPPVLCSRFRPCFSPPPPPNSPPPPPQQPPSIPSDLCCPNPVAISLVPGSHCAARARWYCSDSSFPWPALYKILVRWGSGDLENFSGG